MMKDNRQAVKANYISTLLEDLPIPKNQIASISGLTNTYIRDLEQANFINVPRDKLITFAVAVNLKLTETDELLHVFDRARLTSDDVTHFSDAFDKMKLTSAVYPILDYFAYELACGSIEQHPGKQIIVNDRPTNSLKEPGHRTHSESVIPDAHPIFFDLIEAIGKKRRQILERTVANHVVEHIVFREYLENYILNCEDKKERDWRKAHVANLLKIVKTYPNFRLFLVETSSSLTFTIKYPEGKKSVNPMLTYCALDANTHYIQKSRRLTGFATSSQVLVKNFEREAEDIKEFTLEKFREKSHLINYLEELIGK